MEENKLYNALSSAGYYTKSQAEFEQQFSTPDAQDRLYKSLNESQFYTKSSDEFKTQFFGDVKKKESSVLGFGDSKSLSSTPEREFLQTGEVVKAEPPTTGELVQKEEGSETVKALKSSSARAFGGIIGLPSFIEDNISSFVVKPIMKGVGFTEDEANAAAIALKTMPIAGTTISGIQSAESQQQLNKYASSIEATMKQYEDGIIGSITEGNYSDAGAQLWKGAVQTLPYLAMTIATSGGGTPAVLSAIGTTAAAQRYGELQDPTSEEGKKLSETGKFVNSWGYGAFEAAGELVTMGLANAAKRTLSSLGKEALEEVSQGIAKQAMKGFAEEGASEGATELSQQVLDIIQGVRDNVDFSAVTDAILVGGVTGAGISGTPTAISKAAKAIAGRKVASDADIKTVNENNAKVVDLLAEKEKATSPEAAQVIDTQLQEVVNANNEIITKNETIVEQMTPEQILKVNELDRTIAEYDSRIDDETETTDPNVLKSIRDELQKQKEEVVSVAAEQVSKTAPKEEAIKPKEAISEPVEPLSPKEAPIVSPEQKEGLKQEFSDFYNIVQESKTSDEAFKKAQAIKNVPSDVSKAFREKYDPEETLTPKAAFDRFYEEVKQKQTKQESVVGDKKADIEKRRKEELSLLKREERQPRTNALFATLSNNKMSRVSDTQQSGHYFRIFNIDGDNAEFEFYGDDKEALARRVPASSAFDTNGDIANAEYIRNNVPGKLKKNNNGEWEIINPIQVSAINTGYFKNKINAKYDAELAALESKQQENIPLQEQITEVKQVKQQENGKETSDEAQGRKEGQQEELLTDQEEKKVSETTGVKPKNLRDVYRAGREIFGLNKVQALAQAIIVDRVVAKAAKNSGKTKQQIYSEIEFRKDADAFLKSKLPTQQTLQGKRGATVSLDSASIIYALTDPNVSTPLHEIAHVYERYMLPSEKAAVLAWTGHKTWSVETSEKFARGFEKYLAEGVAPTEKLKAVFERFKQWLVDIYNGITGSEIDLQLNDDMSRLYDSMITGKKYTATEKKVATSVKKYTETFDDVDSLLFQDTLFQGEYKTERHTKAINNLIDNFEKAGNKDIATAVTNYLQERGNPVSEEIVNNVLKQRGHAKGTGKGTEKTGQQTQGVESGKEGRLRVRDNEKNGVEAQKGEGIKQKISQHYKKLVDGKSGVSAKTREILINKDGAYDVITKASLNSFADELIGSVLADGVDGLDMLFEDLKQVESKLIPSNLTGATIVLSYKLAYQYERLGEFDKAAEVDMWRKKMGTELGQMLSAFDEMSGIPEERIRQLRGELLADREAKLEQTGTTGKKISEEISDVQGELNEEAIKALKEENEQLRKKIKDILNANAPKGDVKAKPTLLSKEKSKALADKIRSFKIKEDKLMAADPLTAAYVITRNGTLSLVAEIVEQTGNVSEAISKGIKALRDSEWYKNLNKSEQTVYENKYRTFLKDEFGLSNQFNLEQINIEGLTEEVLGIVNDHWTKLKKQEKSLETKLIEAGLDTKTAQKVAQTAKELVYDYIKENGLTNIKKLFQEKSTTTARKKIKETASQTILNMIREGAVTSDGLVDALADFYGYGNVGFELLDKAAKIANEAASMKPGIRKTMLLEQFEDIIYELDHGTAKKVYDFINSLYNTSILSAPTTTSRAAKGMFLTGLWHFINATVSNPLAAVRGGLRHFGRGAWAGVRVMPNAIATGVGNINVADTPTHTDAIRKIVNKSLSQTWQELKDATEKPNNKKEVIAKTTNLMAKVWFYLPVKMYRTLLALDVPMKTGLIEYEAFIKEYNDAMSTKDGISISRKLSEINKKLGRDNKTIRNMKVEIENEMAEMKKNGERIPKNYAIIREFELMELMRDTETVETARRLAEQALLMNTPEGVATGAMYHLLSMVTKPTAVKVETKDPKTGKVVTRYKVSPQMAAATLAMKFMFPIIRVPANFLRTAAGATPLGLVRALNKTVPTLEGKKRYERTKSNDERIRQATAGAIGTTIGMALAAMMFDYDDDDKTLKLSKDAPIKITLNGTGDDTKNKSISKNYQKLAINFARPDWAKTTAGRAVWDVLMGEDEEWSDPFSYVDNPLGMILAPLGYVSDKLRYEQPEVDEDGNVKPVFDGNIDLFWSMAYNAAAFGTSQSYMQSANDLINLIPQSRKEVPASFNADVYNFVNRPVTALFSPNLYQWAEKQYRAAAGVSEKEYTGMLSNMARLIPSLEDEFSGERTDQFGYPVVREFQIPLVPDAVTSSIDEWKMDKKRMNTDDWKLILSREKVVLPRSWKAADKSLDVYKDEDLNLAEEKAKVAFRDRVLNSIDYLRSLDDDILQKEINFLRQEGINEALIWLETDGRKK